MKGNYNDIVDIILTFIDNEDLRSNIAISGSIVPYLIMEKESNKYHNDFNIYVKEKKIDDVRKIIKTLSKEYEFQIIEDCKKMCSTDHGFKIKYEDTIVNFYPYSIINNNFILKTYTINEDEKIINLKSKKICDITKNAIIRLVKFGNKNLRIISPEFIMADMNIKEIKDEKTYKLLSELSDESILKVLTDKMCKAEIIRKSEKIKKISLF